MPLQNRFDLGLVSGGLQREQRRLNAPEPGGLRRKEGTAELPQHHSEHKDQELVAGSWYPKQM